MSDLGNRGENVRTPGKVPRLALFGCFRFIDAAGASPSLGQKARALLAMLALARGGAVPKDRLSSLLWSDRGERQARDSLKHALAELRQALGDACGAIRADDGTVRLDPHALNVDVAQFEALADHPSPDRAAGALALFGGDLLDGIAVRDPAFCDWLAAERQRLRALAERAAARIIETAMVARDADRAEVAAQWILTSDPYREDAVRALMRLRAGRGDRSGALRHFANLRDRLRDELQVEPEPETAALHREIATSSASPAPEPRVGGRASVAVLPFRNESGDPDEAYFADGVAEDIITALSHYRWFPVAARNTSFAYRDRTSAPRDIAREIGARYVLGGSVRRIGDRVRLTAELVEPETGLQVWSERYDRDLADIFAIQDDLARQVVGAIEPEILIGESQRALSKPTTSLDAYDCHMRGVWYHNLQGGPEEFDKAIRWQRRAIALDPGFARAYMILSRSIYARALYGYSDDLDRDRRGLLEAATRAVELADRDGYAHYAMCCAHLLDHQPAAAVVDAERAVELAPNLALAQNALGWARIFAGRFAEAIGPIETAMRLSPRDPITYFFNSRLGLAHYHLGNYEAAVKYSQRSLYSRPRYFNLLVLLAGLGQLGRTEEARALLPQADMHRPPDAAKFWTLIFPYADPADRAAVEQGLRKAGLEW